MKNQEFNHDKHDTQDELRKAVTRRRKVGSWKQILDLMPDVFKQTGIGKNKGFLNIRKEVFNFLLDFMN